jgi:hypothetical protein
MNTTDSSSDFSTDKPAGDELLPPLVLGVGDGRGFSGHVGAAKLAVADALDPVGDGFELRIHGVGGSSPEQLLEQSETVQVGGDDTAQFVRRVAVARRPTVEWPLEGYWWGGLTSNAATRAFWVFLIPLTLCNLASWMLPASRSPRGRHRAAGSMLPPVMRLAGYALTLLLAASLATAAIDLFGWQCELAPPMRGVPGRCSPLDRLPGWVQGVLPEAPGPRLVIFALIPVLVLALIGYACHRTLRSYERWTMPASLPGDNNQDHNAKQAADGQASRPWWPLTAGGFWHGLRPVRRQQLLHLAGAAALISLYLALVPASHPGLRMLAVIVAVVLLVPPAVLLLFPLAGRPGVNPHGRSSAATKWGRSDRWCIALLVVSVAALVTLLLARIWWQPITPARPRGKTPWTGVGLIPGDATIWGWLTYGMGALLITAAALTWLAKGKDARQLGRPFRPFAKGLLAPLTLGLAFVTGGIFAAGLNLLLPHLLIGKPFQSTAPAISGIPWKKYPLRLPVPTYGFIFAFLGLAAAAVLLAIATFAFWGIPKWRKTKQRSHLRIFYKGDVEHLYEDETVRRKPEKQHKIVWKAEKQRHKIAVSWTKARLASHLGVAVTVLSLAGIGFAAVFDSLAIFGSLAPAWNSAAQSWLPGWAQAGQWLLLPAVVFLYGFTLQAYKDDTKRRAIGVLWDVGNFWPRASQPLAPPCYMERSIPETVNRLRRALADKFRDRDNRGYEFRDRKNTGARTDPAADPAEKTYIKDHIEVELGKDAAGRIVLRPQKWVLVNGYSQGSPIAAAVIAQLPQELRDKITLVTVGCPLRRLYGRAFPAYFGQHCLLDLASKLTAGQPPVGDFEDAKVNVLPRTRWRNLIRPSDYVGSYVFEDTMELDPDGETEVHKNGECLIDKRLLDPPRIIPTHGTTPPPIHEHSDYWPDPQTAVHTQELLLAHGLWPPGSADQQAVAEGGKERVAQGRSVGSATPGAERSSIVNNADGRVGPDAAATFGASPRQTRSELTTYRGWQWGIGIGLALLLGGAIYLIVRQSYYLGPSATEWFAGDTVVLGLIAVVAAFATAVFAYPTFVDWRDQISGPKPTMVVRYGMADGITFDILPPEAELRQSEPNKSYPTFQFAVNNPSKVALRDGRLSIFVQPANGDNRAPYVVPQPKNGEATKFEIISHVYWREEPKLPAMLLSTECSCPPRGISYFEERFKFPETEVYLRIVLTGSNLRVPWTGRYKVRVTSNPR